jgi:NADP-dependent 3-hydroxy acid dehydrogenase YdfG
MNENISGKVVVITGASSGLGEATARRLGRAGARLVLGARRVDRLDAIVAEIVGGGGEAVAHATDVTRRSDVQALIDTGVARFGRIDVLINNAGVMPNSTLDRLKVEDWDHMIDVNLKGVLYGIAAALPVMQAQGSGHIINVSSTAGHKVRAGSAVYSATKHAVRVISEGLRQELKPSNIRTTIISPGAVDTELPGSVTEADIGKATKRWFEALAVPADTFARAVVYAMEQPESVDVSEIVFRPTAQEY